MLKFGQRPRAALRPLYIPSAAQNPAVSQIELEFTTLNTTIMPTQSKCLKKLVPQLLQ